MASSLNKTKSTFLKINPRLLPEQLRLLQRGLSELESDVLLEGGFLADNLGSSSRKVVISEAGEFASSLLNVDSEALNKTRVDKIKTRQCALIPSW